MKHYIVQQSLRWNKSKAKLSLRGVFLAIICYFAPIHHVLKVLVKKNRKFVLELRESLLIMRDKHSLNRKLHYYTYYTKYSYD